MTTRLPLPPTWSAPPALFAYREYAKDDATAFFGPYELSMLDGKSRLAKEWREPNEITTYGLGDEPLAWLRERGLDFTLERVEQTDEVGSFMFIHLQDDAARDFEARWLRVD